MSRLLDELSVTFMSPQLVCSAMLFRTIAVAPILSATMSLVLNTTTHISVERALVLEPSTTVTLAPRLMEMHQRYKWNVCGLKGSLGHCSSFVSGTAVVGAFGVRYRNGLIFAVWWWTIVLRSSRLLDEWASSLALTQLADVLVCERGR